MKKQHCLLPAAVLSLVLAVPAHSDPTPTFLQNALDCVYLNFTTDGDATWSRTTSMSHDGVDSAQSGSIGNNQSTWLKTPVIGPVLVSFWWAVDSEAGHDKLKLLVDGVERDSISGCHSSVRFSRRKVLMGSGDHDLCWQYDKDGTVKEGFDCGWVDQVICLPYPERKGYHDYRMVPYGTPLEPMADAEYFTANGESGFSGAKQADGSYIWYVWGSGNALELQNAVNSAAPGDTILVYPGCYRSITIDVDNLAIVSVEGPWKTYINAYYADRCATFDGTTGSSIAGFTLVQGYSAGNGGGVSGGIVRECRIVGCQSDGRGGGAYNASLTDCKLESNLAWTDGGAASACTLNRCEATYNRAFRWGGGIDTSTATGCLFAYNQAVKGGGAEGCTLMSCTVADNEASDSFGGVWYCTVRNSIVSGNTAPKAANWSSGGHSTFTYCCTYPVPPGSGNLNVNPGFVDRAAGNYHLSNISKCRDKGNKNLTKAPYDLAGLDRVMGSNIDVGCYEYATGVTPLDPADYDGDGVPDIGFYNPATSTWFIRQTFDDKVRREKFGFAGVTIIPRDYDGDGIRDLAFYNPNSGYWQILMSTTGEIVVKKFGAKGISLVDAADVSGDGAADLIYFDTASKTCKCQRLEDAGMITLENFGWAGIKPVCGDYDGDGQAEIAYYSPTSGIWYFRWANNSRTSLKLGASGVRVFPLDVDFDGTLDPCYFDPATGKWTWQSLVKDEGGTVKFGDSTVTPHPFDWDGDGVPDTLGFYSPYRAGFLDLFREIYGGRTAYMINF